MSAKKQLCSHCGASMMVNQYSLSRTLLRALAKLKMNPGRPAREFLSKSQFANYTKLKFWGFIRKLEDGVWIVTPQGDEFLRGDLITYKEIFYFRDQVVDVNGRVGIFDIMPTEESKQKYRELMRPYLGGENGI